MAVASGAESTPINLVSDLVAAGSSVLGATVGPIIYRVAFSSTTSDTNPGCNYGILVWDSTKLAAGQFPDPTTDSEDQWMIQTSSQPGNTIGTGGPIVVGSSILYGDYVRLKSMRRLKQMHDMPFFVVHNDGSASLNFSLFAKTLVRLP